MHNPFDALEERLVKIESTLNKILDSKEPKQKDVFGDIELACQITKLKKATIYSHVHKRKMPFHKKLGKLYFSRDELEAWLLNASEKEKINFFPRHKNQILKTN
jgi:excisionase family DNA binding protein